MKKLVPVIVLISCLISAGALAAQRAKYNRTGHLIYSGTLLTDTTGCEPSRIFAGRATKVVTTQGENADSWEITIRLAGGKSQKFQASLPHSEGAFLIGFDRMFHYNPRLKIKGRQCGSGGSWTAEEIWRL